MESLEFSLNKLKFPTGWQELSLDPHRGDPPWDKTKRPTEGGPGDGPDLPRDKTKRPTQGQGPGDGPDLPRDNTKRPGLVVGRMLHGGAGAGGWAGLKVGCSMGRVGLPLVSPLDRLHGHGRMHGLHGM